MALRCEAPAVDSHHLPRHRQMENANARHRLKSPVQSARCDIGHVTAGTQNHPS